MNTDTNQIKVKVLLYFSVRIKPKTAAKKQFVNASKIFNTNFCYSEKLPVIFKKLTFFSCFLLFMSFNTNAQIELAHVSVKNFKAFGFGGFLNFSLPVSEANYLTIEGGLQYFKDKNDNDLVLVPALFGYRYTLNQTGNGLYLEPNAGYCFGGSSLQKYDAVGSPIAESDGTWAVEKVAGPIAGLRIGYLFEPSGNIHFNVGIRYQRT